MAHAHPNRPTASSSRYRTPNMAHAHPNMVHAHPIMAQVLLDLITVDGPYKRNRAAPRAKTQLQMDRLYVRQVRNQRARGA
eukprot:3383468-Prymnesium_polylepis.1